MEEVGIEFYPDSNRTRQAKLIVRTDNDYVCTVKVVDNRKTSVAPILVRREDVLAVKYGAYAY